MRRCSRCASPSTCRSATDEAAAVHAARLRDRARAWRSCRCCSRVLLAGRLAAAARRDEARARDPTITSARARSPRSRPSSVRSCAGTRCRPVRLRRAGAARRGSRVPRGVGGQGRGAVDRVRAVARAAARMRAASTADRIAAQLARLDEALAAFSTSANRRVSDAVGFDVARWTQAVTAGAARRRSNRRNTRAASSRCNAPTSPARSPCSRARTRACSTRSRGAAPRSPRVVARWRPDQFVEISGAPRRARQSVGRHRGLRLPWVLRRAPVRRHSFRGRDARHGRGASARSRNCAAAATTPPSTGIGGEPVAATWRPTTRAGRCRRRCRRCCSRSSRWQRPAACGVRDANRIVLGSTPACRRLLDRPHHRSGAAGARATRRRLLHRSPGRLPRRSASRARRTTGSRSGIACSRGAMVRMAAVAIIDVESGRIEALAGALSPCTREEYDGPGRSPQCDKRMPYPIRYRPDALLNPAVFHDAMPASIDQADHGHGVPLRSRGRQALARGRARGDAAHAVAARATACAASSCAPTPRASSIACSAPIASSPNAAARGRCRPRRSRSAGTPTCAGRRATIAASATCCSAAPCRRLPRCLSPAPVSVPYGRLMVEPASERPVRPCALRKAVPLDPAKVATCAAGPDGRRGTQGRLGEVPRAAWSSTSPRKGGARATRARARSASPA